MENYMNINHDKVSEQQFPDTILSWEKRDNKVYFNCSRTKLEVKMVTDRIIRFRFAPYGSFQRDFSYSTAQNYGWDVVDYKVEESETDFMIGTAQLNCFIAKDTLNIRIEDKEGNIISEDEKGYHWQEHKIHGGEIIFNTRKVQPGEHFYGLGDKSADIDLRGKRFENWGKDTYAYTKETDPLYKNIPFFIGLHHKIAYGIFFDNSFRSFFDFGHERPNAASFWAQGGEMNYYFVYGPSMMDVVKQYTVMTGVPELPPLWTLGYHQCKWSYYPEEKVREITSTFRKKKIPCDAFYLDIDYMDGFRCFTWHPEHFPNPKKMVSDLEKDGFKTVVIIDPGIKIDPNYKVYQEALDKGYFCKRMDGPLMKGSVWPGECNFPDFTNPEVRTWWADLFQELIDTGVKGVWNDMNEPAVFEVETFPYDVRHDYDGDPCSHRKAHNVYGMQMAKATYEGVKKFRAPNRPFVITRSAYAGIQKVSSVWTGDNTASWDHLVIANNQCQRLSISGVSFCGSDIGGFIGNPTGELYVRWIQLGIFHTFCRTHSSGDHGDQEPWSFGMENELLVKKFIEMRYQMLPYLYTSFYEYVRSGAPILRPLILMDQNDTGNFNRQDEFGVGDNLLVCPILNEKMDGRWLYLPSGNWYYWWDNAYYEGNQEVWAEAALDRVPLFIKAGTVLPWAPVMQYVGEKKIDELTLHVYYGSEKLESNLYEDEGDGYGYADGNYLYKRFYTEGNNKYFEVVQTKEGNFHVSYDTYDMILHGLPFVPKKVTVDDKELKFEVINPDKNLIRFTVSENFSNIKIK
ncbi:MAG: glycoside hydrolase family 31 protein [Cytophagaceae bacterium]